MSEPDFSPRFWLGAALLCLNQPIGWGGVAFFSYLAVRRGKKLYHLFGILCYALSWGLLALGVWLAGKEGLAYSKKALQALKFSISWEMLLAGILVLLVSCLFAFLKSQSRKSRLHAKSE